MLSFYIESTVAVYDVDPNCRNQAITLTTTVSECHGDVSPTIGVLSEGLAH